MTAVASRDVDHRITRAGAFLGADAAQVVRVIMRQAVVIDGIEPVIDMDAGVRRQVELVALLEPADDVGILQTLRARVQAEHLVLARGGDHDLPPGCGGVELGHHLVGMDPARLGETGVPGVEIGGDQIAGKPFQNGIYALPGRRRRIDAVDQAGRIVDQDRVDRFIADEIAAPPVLPPACRSPP